MHTLQKARGYTATFFVPWVRPWAPQETLISMLRQKSSNFTAERNPLNKCVHTWIHMYKKTGQHLFSARNWIEFAFENCISHKSCMTCKPGYLYAFIG